MVGPAAPRPLLGTPRLALSPLTPADAPAMYAYRSHPEVLRFQPFEPASLLDVETFIADRLSVAFDTPGTRFQCAIRLKDTGLIIGDLGTRFPADETRQAEIGLTVSPDHQGRGFGTEAFGGMLNHLFGNLHKHRVFASVDPGNASCIALLKRVGMRQEAHFRQSFWFKGAWVDDLVFGILASEWKGRQET